MFAHLELKKLQMLAKLGFGRPALKECESCPSKHQLKAFSTTVAGFSCNRCSLLKDAPVGTKMYGCRDCDFDVCEACFNGIGNKPAEAPAATNRVPAPTVTVGPSQELLKQIQIALNNPSAIETHSKAWFKRYDTDGNGTLSLTELYKLCTKLNNDMGIPPVEETLMQQLMRKFDTDDDGLLSLIEFNTFYTRLLMTVRDHYGAFHVRREYFLEKRKGKPGERYKVKKVIGQGSFGVVSLVEDLTTKQPMVLKTINKEKSRMSPDILEQEFKNLVMLDHPHIIRLFDYYDDYSNIYVVMDQAEGGELLDVIERSVRAGKPVPEGWTMSVFKQVLEAIVYCHSHGVMHKDLKAENIMLTRKDPVHTVVIDFGLAEAFKSGTSRSNVVSGTPYTMAPEVWQVALRKGSIGYKCDIYSIGCVLFHALSGTLPVMARGCDPSNWLTAIKRGPNWDLIKNFSPEAVDICKKMMSYSEESRPTARECLNHPWFKMSADSLASSLTPEQTKALSAFATKSAFEKTVMLQVATIVRVADIPKITDLFESLDSSSDGVLDRASCAKALTSLGFPPESAAEVAAGLDLDGNNKIEYSELAAGIMNIYEEQTHNLLWGAFSQIDADSNGVLDEKEVRQLMKKGELQNSGLTPPDTEIDRVVASMDRDQSGKISFDEFKAFMTSKKKV